jgi:hypothetical protein
VSKLKETPLLAIKICCRLGKQSFLSTILSAQNLTFDIDQCSKAEEAYFVEMLGTKAKIHTDTPITSKTSNVVK